MEIVIYRDVDWSQSRDMMDQLTEKRKKELKPRTDERGKIHKKES